PISHRPNGIGQSVVRLDRVEAGRLFVSGIDLLDGTPIVDIKPYVPYADALPEARNEMAGEAPELIEVQWSESALAQARSQALRLERSEERRVGKECRCVRKQMLRLVTGVQVSHR